MKPVTDPLLGWPALEGWAAALPVTLSYERGVWGKLHGAASDFRWIATTPAFAAAGRRQGLAGELNLGTEDAPRAATHWRSVGDLHYAVSSYPSRASDAAGRSSFLEKQVLEWRRPPELPAAVGALALLPLVASLDDNVWWGRPSTTRWSADEDATLGLSPSEHSPPLALTAASLRAAIGRGLDALAAATNEQALGELYTALLAGGRAIRLRDLAGALPAEAVAALLLPLPRASADRVSIAGWVPAQRIPDREGLERRWELALGGDAPVGDAASSDASSPMHRRQGQAMATTLLARDRSRPTTVAPARHPSSDTRRTIELAMWGPPSAGKTALLAKLYIDGQGEWEVYPTESSHQFIEDMRHHMSTDNSFPPATVVGGKGEPIHYQLVHRASGVEVALNMQDRAGDESVRLSEAIRASLANAAGLVLLFDPLAEGAALGSQVWRTLEQVHIASGRGTQKDERPVAVCVSKADELIGSPDDVRQARDEREQDAFVRQHDRMGLVKALDRFCTNYRLFPVSAAGVLLRHGVVEPTVFYDEKLVRRIRAGGEMLNLMAPFAWLLEQVTRGHAPTV